MHGKEAAANDGCLLVSQLAYAPQWVYELRVIHGAKLLADGIIAVSVSPREANMRSGGVTEQ